jgi:predicted  nucleic acid-binding Zn-ribbon protein
MGNVKLGTLSLHNFKGIRDFTLTPDGQSLDVFGDNATGKTTLSDALHWLLFDKDSTGAKDFAIKTTDESGEAIHNLDHSVKATLDVGGKMPLVLEKVYREQWTKKRGSATSSFTGHTTDYFVDGVPVPLKDYKARIAELGDEETFRLLTNPSHFNSLHWADRRRILLEVCGDIADAEVIASNKKLKRLPDLLRSRSLDDERKVLAARRKEINAELERIPVRITEVERGLPEKPGETRALQSIDSCIAAVREEIARIEAGGEVAEATKRKREIEAELLELDNQDRAAANAAHSDADTAASAKRRDLSAARDRLAELSADRDRNQRTVDENSVEIARKQERMKALRDRWTKVDADTFAAPDTDTVCAACGQDLPAGRVKAAHDKAFADFNRVKAEQLEAITAEGRTLKTAADELAGKNEQIRQTIDELAQRIADQQTVVDGLSKEEAAAPVQATVEIPENPMRACGLKALAAVESEIAALTADTAPKLEALRDEIGDLTSERRVAEQAARDLDAITKGQARIKELAAEEKTLAKEFEQLEADLFLTEEFVRAKVELLESRINARFSLVRFRLFEQQINGGLAECCETLVGGIGYKDMNSAAKVQAGMDIIKTLSEFYGLAAPIFVDNRESVVELPAMDCQVISLYVSADDKALRVEKVSA